MYVYVITGSSYDLSSEFKLLRQPVMTYCQMGHSERTAAKI